MKLLDKNERQELVKVTVETADDLWFLHTIVDTKDRCTGDSEYKYKLGDAKGDNKTQIVKKRVWVTVVVEKTEFSASTGQLRISGKVVDGSVEVPRGSYHTLDIAEGSALSIVKDRWFEYQQEKLNEALSNSRLQTLVVLFDREQAILALLKPNGHEILLSFKGNVPKKGVDEGKVHAFYKEIVQHITTYKSRLGIDTIIAACPSFWKEYLEKEFSAELKKQVLFTTVSTIDESAFGEILRRPELQQALRSQRSAREQQLVDALLAALAKDKLIYSMPDVRTMLQEGNIAEVTVTENLIMKMKQEDKFAELEVLLRTAADIKAKVHLLSTQQAMQKIDGLGGIVGVKRW